MIRPHVADVALRDANRCPQRCRLSGVKRFVVLTLSFVEFDPNRSSITTAPRSGMAI